MGPELEEIEGGRCDGVQTDPQDREKKVPVVQVAGVELSIRAMPTVGESGESQSLSPTIRSRRVESECNDRGGSE